MERREGGEERYVQHRTQPPTHARTQKKPSAKRKGSAGEWAAGRTEGAGRRERGLWVCAGLEMQHAARTSTRFHSSSCGFAALLHIVCVESPTFRARRSGVRNHQRMAPPSLLRPSLLSFRRTARSFKRARVGGGGSILAAERRWTVEKGEGTRLLHTKPRVASLSDSPFIDPACSALLAHQRERRKGLRARRAAREQQGGRKRGEEV